MPGLDPGIHQKRIFRFKGMDCRVKPGNDARRVNIHEAWYNKLMLQGNVIGILPDHARVGRTSHRPVRVRDLTRGGYKEQVRGYCRKARYRSN
jgi:hypothetical protein